MDQFNYIKLIEFHYILEGFTALYKNESDKSSKGIMYRTADQILHEIFQSCVRTVVREETKIKLSRKWREIALERCCLDVSIFNDVHNEITCSLDEFITKKYIEERYTNQWMQNKQREADYAAMVSSSNSINSINSINSTNSATTSSSTSTSTTTTTGINNNNNNMGMVCPSLVSLSTVSSSVPINMINGSLGSEASTKVQLIQSNNNTSNNNNSNIIPILANGASCYSVPSTTVKPPSRNYQSMLSLDSGFQSETSKNTPFSMDGSIVNESEVSSKSSSSKNQRSKSKQEKTRDKFALLPKELLENECSSGGDTVLTRHIKKTFPSNMMFNEEQIKQAQRNYPQHLRPNSKTSSNHSEASVHKHLPNTPSAEPVVQVLMDKLESLLISR